MEKISLTFLGLITTVSLGLSTVAAEVAEYSNRLPIGMGDAERLTYQHTLALPVSLEHLQEYGDLTGKIVIDLGSGGGDMTVVLAQMVGSSGHVYAIDMYEEQIAVAKDKVKAVGLNNVTFIKANILDESLFNNWSMLVSIADVVFTRFFMMHVSDPEKAIENIFHMLKPGGTWISEETVIDSLRSTYAPDFIETYKQFFKKRFQAGKLDADCYLKLPGLAEKTRFQKITHRIADRRVSPNELRQVFLNNQAAYHMAIAHGLLSEQNLLGWWQVVSLAPESAEMYLNGLHCLTATK